jgi:hypothetical protein
MVATGYGQIHTNLLKLDKVYLDKITLSMNPTGFFIGYKETSRVHFSGLKTGAAPVFRPI